MKEWLIEKIEKLSESRRELKLMSIIFEIECLDGWSRKIVLLQRKKQLWMENYSADPKKKTLY